MAEEKKEETQETQQNEENGVDTSEQFKQLEEKVMSEISNISKVLDKFGTERGKERKEREDLFSEVGSIKELLQSQSQKAEESEFDPYDKDRILELIDDKIKPLSGQKFLTEETFKEQLANMLSAASENATVQTEFGLKPEELNELVAKSAESGQPVRLLAFDKYAERKFKNKEYLEKLSEELKNNDTTPPPESASETVFDKTGIPSDPVEFERWYNEKEAIAKGSAKKALADAERKARG